MKVLVGMPAYKLEGSVRKTLNSMVGFPATILVIDNNSAEDVKKVLRDFAGRIEVITNSSNRGCNGAWNQVLDYGISKGYDVIGLQTDTICVPGWYNFAMQYLASHPKEVVVANTSPFSGVVDHTHEHGGVPLSFYPRAAAELVYPIPPNLFHWFGDAHMHVTLQRNGWKMTVVSTVQAWHSWSEVMAVSPEVNPSIAKDKAEWRRLYPDIVFE